MFINGAKVGRDHTDQMPFVVDLTHAAQVDEENELLIAVTDWVSCTAPELMPGLLKTWSSAWFQGRGSRAHPLFV